MKLTLATLLNLLLVFQQVKCFVPLKLIDLMVTKTNEKTKLELGKVGETLTHEEILKRGMLRSVAKYFHDKLAESSANTTTVNRINLTKLDTGEYYHLRELFYDFYQAKYCSVELEVLLKKDFQYHVADVDFDKDTKDLPQAHFDANEFEASNQRVIRYLHLIHYNMESHEYGQARRHLGTILHTIHDFYSHSNWIELGNTQICHDIGTEDFVKNHVIANASVDNVTCISNCKIFKARCNLFTEMMFAFFKLVDFKSPLFNCPVKFYRCESNVVVNKLTSGYYVSQKLPNGDEVNKPKEALMCSHGGVVDSDSFSTHAKGGLNKDSSYYVFSPRADLHQAAADLAVKHTEFLFDRIRAKYGDRQFARFLHIDHTLMTSDLFKVCSRGASRPEPRFVLLSMVSALLTFAFALPNHLTNFAHLT